MTTWTRGSSTRRAALGVLLGLGAAAGPATAATLIQMCPYTITVPDLYVLARDLDCPGDGITIAADNVHLVLAGHTLTGSGGEAGVRAEGTRPTRPSRACGSRRAPSPASKMASTSGTPPAPASPP